MSLGAAAALDPVHTHTHTGARARTRAANIFSAAERANLPFSPRDCTTAAFRIARHSTEPPPARLIIYIAPLESLPSFVAFPACSAPHSLSQGSHTYLYELSAVLARVSLERCRARECLEEGNIRFDLDVIRMLVEELLSFV